MNFPHKDQVSTPDSLCLRGIYREEIKSLQRIRAAATLTNPVQNLSIFALRYRILRGVLLSLLSHSWRQVENTRIFILIQIGSDASQKIILADKKLSTVIAGRSLKELDALYLLLHYKRPFPRVIRRLFIAILIRWLRCNLPYLIKNIFFVRQDYYGTASIIVTLSKFHPLKVIAFQHGLMIYKDLENAKIYPNYRVGIEAVYNDAYAEKIGLVKPVGSVIYKFGTLVDCRATLKSKESGRVLIFISSGNLGNLEDILVIRRLNELSREVGCQFLVRPHPIERRQRMRDGLSSLKINSEPKLKLLDRDINNVILIGFFSTLLYEAGSRGFRTVWVTRGKESQDIPEAGDLKNTQFVTTSELSAEGISDLFNLPLYPVTIEPLYPRIDRLISEVFPEQA
jgi:hypothetical protein